MAKLVLHPESTDLRLFHLDKPSTLIGAASDADVSIQSETLSNHHARIEHKPDGYYIISLANTPSVFVNGIPVTFQRLKHGDRIEIGDVKALLLLDSADESAHEGSGYGVPAQEMMLPASMMSAGLTTIPRGPVRCPHCGMPLMPGLPSCPHCGMPLSNLPAMSMNFIPPLPPSQIGPGILPLIAFLAALTVVGAPIALVLGLMTLSIIRRRGGTPRDLALAKWSIGLGLMWLMLGAVAAGGLVRQMQKRKQLAVVAAHEVKIIHALKNLACAQKYAQTIEFFDADADGQGEYGALPVLAQPKTPFFDTGLAGGEAYGYRVTIRNASESQFLAVAEPLRYGETGLRTFVMDQTGQIRGGDTDGKPFGQGTSVLPVLQGERNAYYEIDDEIAKDVLNYVKSISSTLADQEKKQRILKRLREDYALTSVGRELDGMGASVDQFVSEQQAQTAYLDARAALAKGDQDVALAKLMEIKSRHPSFSQIAAVERELGDLRSLIAQKREQAALDLLTQAETLERQGNRPQDVQEMYQRITNLYPDTEVATRVSSLKPELQRQLRDRDAEKIFSDLMELSPERDFDEILNRANQLRRNYSDTDLLSKVKTELAEKERKARANSWRARTEQNMAAGRMRGALGQLETAARENPDLLYDLRDLCIQLYRSVADSLMKEGDQRKALEYYEKLSQLLQASGSQDQVSPDLLAKLHNDVGQADYGNKAYKEARWHLASAAWKYPDDAQFNMRLGAANLYTGLYRPAEASLTRALAMQPDLVSARLYRAYLNMRVGLISERVLADRFKQDAPPAGIENPVKDESAAAKPQQMSVSVSGGGESGDDVVVNTSVVEGDSGVAAPKSLDIKSSNAGGSWFSRFAGNGPSDRLPVPEPTDIAPFLNFDYQSSSSILPGTLQVLDGLQRQRVEKELAASTGRAKAASVSQQSARDDMRQMGKMSLKVSEQKNIAAYHTQLKQLRTLHLKDADARKELCDMMGEMKQRISRAMSDIQSAGRYQPRIQSLTESVLSQIDKKYRLLDKAEALISGCMEDEVDTRKRMLEVAEEMLLKYNSSNSSDFASFDKQITDFRSQLLEEDGVLEVDRALRALRDSMDVRVDLDDILRAAEGNVPVAAGE
jgi:hypothetical protein